MKLLSFIVIIFVSFNVCAEVKIALFSVVNKNTGEIVSPWPMYPNEQRHHAVIEVNNYWYQMKPFDGVKKSQKLSEIMSEYSSLKKEDHTRQVEVFINTELSLEDINLNNYENVTFDLFGHWEDPSTSHCTKFIASIMGYKPLPTKGDEGNLNLSPDDLFDILTSEGWDTVIYEF